MDNNVVINGRNVFFRESGTGPISLLMVHGNTLAGQIFSQQLRDVRLQQRCRLIAVDMPGFGKSENAADPFRTYTVKGLGAFLKEFIRELGLHRVVLLGHSLGGNVVFEVVESIEEVKAIVITGTVPVSPNFRDKIHHDDYRLKHLTKFKLTEREAIELSQVMMGIKSHFPVFLPDLIKRSDPHSRMRLLMSFNLGQFINGMRLLQRLEIPKAFFFGEQDQIVRVRYVKSLHIPKLWKSSVQLIPFSGHLCFYENPSTFNLMLSEFLDYTKL